MAAAHVVQIMLAGGHYDDDDDDFAQMASILWLTQRSIRTHFLFSSDYFIVRLR